MTDADLKKIRRMGKMLNALEMVSPALAGKLAFEFFCTPRRLPLREKDAAFLASAERGSLTLQKQKISTYSWRSELTDARSALLLHGWESNSGRWQKYVKGLVAEGLTVHAIDAPASGNSQGKRLNVILYSNVVKEFIAQNGRLHAIIGHSLGGAAAVMSTTLLEAPKPEKMVLLGVFAESTRVIRDFGQLLGVNQGVIAAIFKEIEKRSGSPIEAYSVAQKTKQLQSVKGLVVHDADDAVAPVEEGRMVAETWGASFLKTEGFGHRLQEKSVVRAVIDFITQP